MKRVLLVDDETPFLRSLKDGFAPYTDEFAVLTAGNGKEALEVLEAIPIDLVITDLKMPVMDGFELLGAMARRYRTIPVVVMTAYGTPIMEQKLQRLSGSFDYLEKPLDLDTLLGRIRHELAAGAKDFARCITLPTYLQLLELEKKSCTLCIKTGKSLGFLHFRQGQLIDASVDDGRAGKEAARSILGWDNAEIDLDPVCRSRSKPLDVSINGLLMEAVREHAGAGEGASRERSMEVLRTSDATTSGSSDSRARSESSGRRRTGRRAKAPLTPEVTGTDEAGKGEKNKGEERPATSSASPSTGKEWKVMSIKATLERFNNVEGFIGVGVFSPQGDMVESLTHGSIDINTVGMSANNALLNAQKATDTMGVGRGNLIQIRAPKANLLMRCLNEATDFAQSKAGKAHFHTVVVIEPEGNAAMARMILDNMVSEIAEQLR